MKTNKNLFGKIIFSRSLSHSEFENRMAEETQARTLYQMVTERVEFAKTKVEELREKLKDFDATSSGREKASAYFGKALDRTQEAIAELTKQAQALKVQDVCSIVHFQMNFFRECRSCWRHTNPIPEVTERVVCSFFLEF